MNFLPTRRAKIQGTSLSNRNRKPREAIPRVSPFSVWSLEYIKLWEVGNDHIGLPNYNIGKICLSNKVKASVVETVLFVLIVCMPMLATLGALNTRSSTSDWGLPL